MAFSSLSFSKSLLLLYWLFFKPSAWQNLINRLDPQLLPNFAFSDLQATHWQHSEIRNLLLLHLLFPLYNSIFLTVGLWLFGFPANIIIFVCGYTVIFSLIMGLISSFIVSVAFGLLISSIGSLLLSLPIIFAGRLVFEMGSNIALMSVLAAAAEYKIIPKADEYALLSVIIGVFCVTAAASLMYNTQKSPYQLQPQYRQIGSVVIGAVISSVMVYILINAISTIASSSVSFIQQNGFLFGMFFDSLISGVFGLAFIVIWFIHTWRWQTAIVTGLSVSAVLSFLTFLKNHFPAESISHIPLLFGLHGGLENALLYASLFTFPYVLAKKIANTWAGIVAGIFGSAGVYVSFTLMMGNNSTFYILPLIFSSFILGLTITLWRPLLFYPIESALNMILLQLEEQRDPKVTSLIYWHSVYWDEHQYLPLFGLETYLVQLAEKNPEIGKTVIEHLCTTPQSWAARAAQIELDARRLEICQDVLTISQAYRSLAAGELTGPASALLRSFSRLSRDVDAALSQESSYNQRLAIDSLEERLDGLLRELTRSSEPYALRFQPIAASWRQVLANHTKVLSEAVESRQEIPNPYVIGIPLTEHQEIFVGRSDISAKIEKLLLDSRCPPLLLYGQRRTGKTSLLNNLGRLLPSTIIPLFVDLQGPASLAKDYAGFLYNIGRAMQASAKRHREITFPPLNRDKIKEDPFTYFDEWLDEIEQQLEPNYTILLSLDEFSTLEHVFKKGYLDEDSVLGMLRHIIQHRPRLKILLAGSHTLDEFERWANYLINVQTVHISYLQAAEAVQLIENPVNNFVLHYAEEATQRIMEITHGHPALIQLMCAEVVTLKNKQNIVERRLATFEDAEAAIPGALQHGRFFFADITNNQVSTNALKLLKFLAGKGEGAMMDEASFFENSQFTREEFELAVQNLLQRELIEQVNSQNYRFQVELIRRWFNQ
jgi:hypothetical protein